MTTRREFMQVLGAGAAASLANPILAGDSHAAIIVNPAPRFSLSPYLYMQFMEPLGTTDSSVEAAWDFTRDCWREDVVEVTKELAPTLIRWGGCFISYYRWKEGVGPRTERKPMLNLLWGGVETNQVGTHEFVDFCRQVGAEPLPCVNFESDGRKRWQQDPKGSIRSAGPEEAADWVRYCNAPDSALRREHGRDRALQRPPLADRQRDFVRPQWLRLRDRRPDARSISPKRCERPIPRSS